jgi:hypothetical protein
MVSTRRIAPDLMRSTGGVRAEIWFRAGPGCAVATEVITRSTGQHRMKRFGDLLRHRIACLAIQQFQIAPLTHVANQRSTHRPATEVAF